MGSVKRPEELEELRRLIINKRISEKLCITVCAGTGCHACGCEKVTKAFSDEISRKHLTEKVDIRTTGCHGFCEQGPIVVIHPKGLFYRRVKAEDVQEIVSETIINKKVIERLLYIDPNTAKKIIYEKDVPFYKKQQRIIFGNNGLIDPKNIEDYLAVGGYKALIKVLNKLTPEKTIDIIRQSELRGRGGAGFPTGRKWEFTRKQKGDVKYVICNADEGDPGAYMDRSLLEGNPHSVIEGMIIGAYAIGAKEGWIYVRKEYPLAVGNAETAIGRARKYGLLGENILDSGFNFDIVIVKGAGAFVCGEETALIQSIESLRGIPKQRPPFPAKKGLFGKPTNINNVETWANVVKIIAKGADWYNSIGTKTSKGTKIFSLVGKVKNTGLVEVPMGITLKEIVYEIGGGSPNGKKTKAIQTGGPSGGCIPAKLFDLPIDYESLKDAGSIMGSGGMIVMDENTCMVDIAKYFTNFLQNESCGKCVPCREGTQRMFEMLKGITEGKGKIEDIEILRQLGNVIKDTSLCGLGQTAPNPVLATLRYFKNEYIDHVEKKRCNAAACKEIVSSPCQHTCPIDTEAQVYISLIAKGRYADALEIIKKDNPLASVLARVCHHPCEAKCRTGEGGEPIAIRNLKRFVSDYALKNNLMFKAESMPKSKERKVAIIGSGPAGLTCGFYLAQKGYGVTIFEKEPVIGGMLALGIPEYRLPREILKADIDYIKSAGEEIRTNSTLGRDFTIDDLFNQGYKAIFIATGAYKSLKLNIPGEDTEGIMHGMEVLTSLNLGKEIKIGRRVGIIGGGNSAVDTARALLRTKMPEDVAIFYRRTIAEMPAFKDEVETALEEGIKIRFLTAPKKIISEGGSLKACEFITMKLGEIDETGRRKPIPVEGSEFTVELDTLIVAISERPDTSFIEKASGLEISQRGGLVVAPETLLTTREGVFAGGDLVTGPNTVVDAVASGKIAAESIDKFLKGQEIKREYKIMRPSIYTEPLEFSDEELEELLSAKRPVMARLLPKKRKSNFKEIKLGLTKEQAIKEARRCLRCDLETEDGKAFLEKLKEASPEKQEIKNAQDNN